MNEIETMLRKRVDICAIQKHKWTDAFFTAAGIISRRLKITLFGFH